MLENNSEKQKSTLKGVLLILALLTFGGLLVAGIVKILALVCSAVLPLLEPLIALGLWGSVGYFAYRYFRKRKSQKKKPRRFHRNLCGCRLREHRWLSGIRSEGFLLSVQQVRESPRV